jgi:hypothetical protein
MESRRKGEGKKRGEHASIISLRGNSSLGMSVALQAMR